MIQLNEFMDYVKCDFSNIQARRYINFINTFQCREEDEHEKHHILPKSIYPEFKNEKWNIACLRPRAHFLAHWILAKIFGGKMWYAFYAMANKNTNSGRIGGYNSKMYEKARNEFKRVHSEWHNTEVDGKLNKNIIGQKTKLTKERRPGYYQEISERSAKTMMETVLDSGLTIAQECALRAAKTTKERGSLTGANNPRTKVIEVYNQNGELEYTFKGDFFDVCKKMGWPTRALKTSYLNGGAPIYSSKFGRTTAQKLGYEKQIGWYAVSVGLAKHTH